MDPLPPHDLDADYIASLTQYLDLLESPDMAFNHRGHPNLQEDPDDIRYFYQVDYTSGEKEITLADLDDVFGDKHTIFYNPDTIARKATTALNFLSKRYSLD